MIKFMAGSLFSYFCPSSQAAMLRLWSTQISLDVS